MEKYNKAITIQMLKSTMSGRPSRCGSGKRIASKPPALTELSLVLKLRSSLIVSNQARGCYRIAMPAYYDNN